MQILGVDFGTSNSVVALAETGGAVRSVSLPFGRATAATFRSVLCFWAEANGRTRHEAGPDAIAAYLEDPLDSRLMMSLKTYLAQRSFTRTRLFGNDISLERLIGLFLAALLPPGLSPPGCRIVAGRPVHFAGETADDAHGEARLRASFAAAGHAAIDIALEPEAAGFRFSRALRRAATVLVGDFGGGTSDFSVLRFEPGAPVQTLAATGVGLAGDSFDVRIIDHAVSPRLGRGGTFRPLQTDLPIPVEYYAGFARWHRLSVMKNPRTLRDMREVARHAAEPAGLLALIRLVEDEAGYGLYQAVAATKAALSTDTAATLRFRHADVAIEQSITRTEFERWIEPDLRRLGDAVDAAIAAAGMPVDQVFLTGGTSFVPAVRRLFEARFGAGKVSGGGEFVAVAEGLALIGQERAQDEAGRPDRP